jgi:hypothetical protein
MGASVSRILTLLTVVLLGFGLVPAQAQDMRSEPVRFAPGTTGTTLSDRITGREYVVYRIGAEAGQRMRLRLTSDNLATYFNVYAPGRGPGDEALAGGDITGPMVPDLNVFEGVLPAAGVYSVSVYLFRSAARRGETSNFRLDISVDGAPSAAVEGDFADGLQGGPDFWEVRLNDPAGVLNVRGAPSTGAPTIGRFPNTAILRNLGCRMNEGRRWCKVEATAPGGITGWVAGEFLVEASAARAGLPAPDGNMDRPVGGVRPEGTAFTATGLTDCTLSRDAATQTCEFGVIREGSGSGMVMVFWPETGTRTIYFENGTPVSFDRSEADGGKEMSVTRDRDYSVVFIGDERYVLPDAIIYGG